MILLQVTIFNEFDFIKYASKRRNKNVINSNNREKGETLQMSPLQGQSHLQYPKNLLSLA